MARIECNFFSDVLSVQCTVNVILPEQSYHQHVKSETGNEPLDRKFPVLYLLHGLGDDHTIWLRRTRVEEYAAAAGIACVVPSVGRSYYTNMDRGHDYWTFISEELPFVVKSMFPLSAKRKENYVAGNSMGGYGAFKMALSHPERFAAAASLSGALNISDRANPEWKEYTNIFGDVRTIANGPNDLFHLAKEAVKSGDPLPLLYQCCGTDDFLYENNQQFKALAEEIHLPVTYEEEKDDHNWTYWDKQIAKVIKWLPR